jgi:two-component system, OmpR family, sensor histidine kinase KdpD
MRRVDPREVLRLLAVAVPSLTIATLGVAVLEQWVGVADASSVYLVAVVATALVAGTPGAILTAVASFLLYDYLFTAPYHTLTITDPREWLSVLLLLFMGIVVGQLVALERSRTVVAHEREREARALFQISRSLSTRGSTAEILLPIARLLKAEAGLERVWVALGHDDASERREADTGAGPVSMLPAVRRVLQRQPGDEPARWVRVHQRSAGDRADDGLVAYRVRIEASGDRLGSIWSLRQPGLEDPDRTQTRLLAAAADQIGQAIRHDRMAAEAQAAEVARQSDAAKSALLQSVSHDLRTPLAAIRTAAGILRPGARGSTDDKQASAEAIDREVTRLDRLVTNLLDLSRIEAGALRAEPEVFELDDLVGRAVDRIRARLGDRSLEVRVNADPVLVDPVFLDEALMNLLENVAVHTPARTQVRLSDRAVEDDQMIRLTIEDGGQGVPEASLSRIFERFYRGPGAGDGAGRGTGIGLAVVRGLVEATGGRVTARRSELGGLAIDIDLPRAAVPVGLAAAGVS